MGSPGDCSKCGISEHPILKETKFYTCDFWVPMFLKWFKCILKLRKSSLIYSLSIPL